MAGEEKFAVLSAKLPAEIKELFEQLAERRSLTPSALLKRLVEAELAGRADYEVGEVEAATRSTLEVRGVPLDGALAASALNVARRLDRDPSSGPANSAQHQRLMRELAPSATTEELDQLGLLRLTLSLRRRGWSLTDGIDRFQFTDLEAAEREALLHPGRDRAVGTQAVETFALPTV
ncbi:hypothetical protein OHB24_27150 [Kribbella sp. NBC_00482]|uniref:hypothetical protein n=1 Tax=Kribbella sp. NBC_00482 TaxID=2975968 RepID=UPI002E17675E